MVVAEKNGVQRKFTDIEWNLLGKTTYGWKKIDDADAGIIHNTIQKPENGEKKSIEISAKQPEDTKEIVDVTEPTSKADDIIDIKQLFIAECKGITKGTIKDYFDVNNIKYKDAKDFSTLVELLGNNLQWSIEKLKIIF